MKISSFAWGFVALVIFAILLGGIGAACYLFSDAHALFAVATIILTGGCVPYLVYAIRQTPLFVKKKDEKK